MNNLWLGVLLGVLGTISVLSVTAVGVATSVRLRKGKP